MSNVNSQEFKVDWFSALLSHCPFTVTSGQDNLGQHVVNELYDKFFLQELMWFM